jgi:hypothetical protein
MAGSTTEQIGRQLRSDEDRLEAIQAINAIEPLSEDALNALADDIAEALATDRNAYTILQLLKQVHQFAESYPKAITPVIEPVAKLLAEALENFEGDNPAQNRRVAQGTEILEAIVNATDHKTTVLELNYQDIAPLIQHGNTEHRALGYRLLGRTATREAVRTLLQDFSHEVGPVVQASNQALSEAQDLTEISLTGDGPVSRLDAIGAFAELYAHAKVEPSSAQLETIHKGVFELSQTAKAEDYDALLSAVELLCKSDASLAEAIVTEAINTLQTEPERSLAMWQLLGAAAERQPSVVVERADTLVRLLSDEESTPFDAALEAIQTAAEGTSSVPASLATRVLELSSHNDNEIALKAIKTVGAMGFYPVPDKIKELAESKATLLSKCAADTQDRLQKEADRTPQFVRTLEQGDKTVGLFAGDTGDIHLKRRDKQGLWRDIDIGALEQGIVEAVVDGLNRDENVPVVFPHYAPRRIVLLAIAATLAAPEQDRQVGLYSPGSRTHWGNKGDIRSLLREFGLSDTSGTVVKATPLPEVVTEAYVGNDGIADNSDGMGPGRMVLSKSVSELIEMPELDVAILNSISKTKLDSQEKISKLEEAHPDATIVSVYSYYTENETKSRPRYGPPLGLESVLTIPGADIIDPILTDIPDSNDGGSRHRALRERAEKGGHEGWYLADEDLRALGRQATVCIDHVDPGPLEELLNAVFEQSASLFEVDDAGAGSLIFSRQMFFERLPIPPDAFDDWVRGRYEDGDRFVPPLTLERIGDVERKAGVVENLQAVQPLNKAKALLERLRDQLQRQNPLFDRLKEYLSEAKDEGHRLAIFRSGVKQAQMLEDVLVDRGLVTREDLDSGPINVIAPNDVRQMEPHDTLLIFGNLHPENAGFYVLPRVNRAVVLTYNQLWINSIERHANEFIELLNATVGDSGYKPYPEPELVGDIEIEDEEAPVDTGHAAATNERSKRKTKAQIITKAMESASTAEYGEDASRYDREIRYYLLETDDGKQYIRTSEDSILRQRTTTGGTELHWTGPESLSEGDTVVEIPDDVREELWRAHLERVYADDGSDASAALDSLQMWHETLNKIWKSMNEELDDAENLSEGEMYNLIHEWISQEVDEFARAPATVRTWFESAQEADRPMHLVQDPALVIGPRSYKDIEAIGIEFGYEDLAANAETIERAMEGLRTMNRQEGHRYRESLRDKVAAGDETRIVKAISYHTLTNIKQADNPSAFEKITDPTGPESELTEDELVERVQELIKFSPTKNSELMNAWGFKSGSDLYEFMSSELDEYYERNNEGLIVPTDAARALIS